MTLENPPLFCVRPFTEFYVDPKGDAHLCCPQWIDIPAGNVLETPPMDIWRGAKASVRVPLYCRELYT